MREDLYKYEPATELVLPRCKVGMEFEFEKYVERILPEKFYDFWIKDVDGSLRDRGMEFTFAEPMFGKDILTAIDMLLDEIVTKGGAAVTKRTGMHIHVDVRDIDLDELKRMCVLYAVFEKAVYNFVGDNRDENIFCIPWYAAHNYVANISALLGVDTFKQDSLRNIRRYGGLNLNALAKYGSVEWRHYTTTTDRTRILNAINLALRFKEAAIRLDNLNDFNLLERISHDGVRTFAQDVFREQFNLIDYPNLDVDVWGTGIDTAYTLLRAAWTEVPSWGSPLDKAAKGTNLSFTKWFDNNARNYARR